MADRLVQCARLGQTLPGLLRPPFPGPLGRRIYEDVSSRAWAEWERRSTELLVNRRLNLGQAGDRRLLLEEMTRFLFGEEPRGR